MRILWRIGKVVGILAAVLFVGMVVLSYAVIGRLREQVRGGPERFTKEIQALRRDGIPTVPEQFQKPLPPPERNAAPDYVRLTALLKAHPIPRAVEDRVALKGDQLRLPPQQEEELKSLLAERTDIMHLIHRAAKKPDCVFRRDWSQGPGMLPPEYASMRAAARLIAGESYLLAREGRWSDAVANQALGFRIAEHTGDDPIYIGYLVDIACDAIAIAGMERILRMAGPDAVLDHQVFGAVALGHPRIDLGNALMGEIASNLVINRKIRQYGISIVIADEKGNGATRLDSIPFWGPKFRREFADASTAETIHYERLLEETAGLSHRRSAYARIINEIHDRLGGPEAPENLATSLAAAVLPFFARAEDKMDLAHDQESVLMAGAAVLAFRARHGFFPSSLRQVMGYTPADHFAGAPLGYRREPKGFVVYSRGGNRFDGGRPGTSAKGDVACFRYP